MRYWYDTEFVEQGSHYPIQPLSIGIVAEDGREFYAQYLEGLSAGLHHSWVRRNVMPQMQHVEIEDATPTSPGRLHMCTCSTAIPYPAAIRDTQEAVEARLMRWQEQGPCPWKSADEIRFRLTEFFDPEKYGKPELWAYYADYDHVVLCQTFGTMIDLPKGYPMYTMDLKQELRMLSLRSGQPEIRLPKQEIGEHNALADARWLRGQWDAFFPLGIFKTG